jgi:DNA mismatch repair protein MLH3
MTRKEQSIQPLPPEIAAQIKASVAIPSLVSAVLGLVTNSLEAEATNIAVNVDFGKGSCSVEDDGRGIAPKYFTVNGGLGKPYRELIDFFE